MNNSSNVAEKYKILDSEKAILHDSQNSKENFDMPHKNVEESNNNLAQPKPAPIENKPEKKTTEQKMNEPVFKKSFSKAFIQKVLKEFKLKFRISRISDHLNTLNLYNDDTKAQNSPTKLDNPPKFDNKVKVYFQFDIYDQGIRANHGKDVITHAFNDPFINQEVEIGIPTDKMTDQTVLTITLFKVSPKTDFNSNNQANHGNIIASTTMTLYDYLNKPREGPYVLLLHKDKSPGLIYDSNTPGIIEEIHNHADNITEQECKWKEENRVGNNDIRDAVNLGEMSNFDSVNKKDSFLKNYDFPH